MIQKCKCPPVGAPEWIITFGDMMSLLLTFFILLLSLSEIKKEDQFRAVVKEVKKAFGMHGGGGMVPSEDDPQLTFIERIKAMQLVSRKLPSKSNTTDKGPQGADPLVTAPRKEEIQIVDGGRVTFEEGSAQLAAEQRQRITELAQLVRGFNTKIHISGHADEGELFEGSVYKDLSDLSYARAKAVADFLKSDACMVRAVRLRIDVNAAHEMLKWTVYEPAELKTNRRVEIHVSNMLVEELTRPEMNISN